jgi:hypothetical protein
MFPFGCRPSLPPRLPRPVPPFPGEASASYVFRLAVANQVDPADLRAHLAGRRTHGPVTLDALASATGRSQHALAWALPELRPGTIPRADPALPGHVRRTVCCRCAARRDAHPFAAVWQPAEISICPSHRIWLGSAAHPRFRRQYDIDGLTEILRAQDRHSRLARRRGRQAAINAIAEASRITAFWARHGHYRDRRVPLIRELRGGIPLTGKLSSWDEVTAVVTYPETVDLARVLAMPRWRSPGPSAGDIQHFQQEIRFSTGIRYEWKDSRNDPLFHWFHKHREALNTESSGGQGTRRLASSLARQGQGNPPQQVSSI